MNLALVPFTCFGDVRSGVPPRLLAGLLRGLGVRGMAACGSVSRWILISGVRARAMRWGGGVGGHERLKRGRGGIHKHTLDTTKRKTDPFP